MAEKIQHCNWFKRCFILILLATTALYTVSCDSGGGSSDGGGGGPQTEIRAIDPFPNFTFTRPLGIENAGDGSNRLFIVEQGGTIQAITPDAPAQNAARELAARQDVSMFLDISDRVSSGDDGEVGLLGLAFHPDFENNGYFYVNYVADGPLRTVISRFAIDEVTGLGDPDSELILLEFGQENAFHNAGQMFFGPSDGLLYITSGDGGPTGEGLDDVSLESQDRSNLLGTILRIDVDNPSGGLLYGIPPDNPYAGNTSGFREEIYAYGFRNPWRASIDPASGLLITADVGQARREEINIVVKGGNYGWHIMEGTLCFDPPSGCDTTGLEMPIWEYGRGQGRSVTGGYIYRGSDIPDLVGRYIYGDFVSGRVWALSLNGTTVTGNEQLFRFADVDTFIIASFGLDEDGEIYIAGISDGKIYKIVEQEVEP